MVRFLRAMTRKEREAYREAGIDPLTTLRAMTSNAAQLIGVYPAKGTVRVGSDADLIAVRSDPLRDLDALRGPVMVMKGVASRVLVTRSKTRMRPPFSRMNRRVSSPGA